MNHTDDRLRAAAQRALESLCDLILDNPDPSPEATAARLQLEEALAAAPAVLGEPTSRAAVLLDAAAQIDAGWFTTAASATAELRRLAAEAQQQTDTEACRPVEVDGETMRVHGAQEMTEQDREFFGEIVRAAKRRYEAEHGVEQQPVAAPRPGDRVRVAYEAVWAPDDDPRMVIASNGEGDRWHNIVPDHARIEILGAEQQPAPSDGDASRP